MKRGLPASTSNNGFIPVWGVDNHIFGGFRLVKLEVRLQDGVWERACA